MSTKREPLLSDELIEQFNEDQHEQCAFDWKMSEDASFHFTNGHLAGMREIIPHYEASRAKDAERIEQLEALCRAVGNGLDEMMRPANRECDGAHCTGCWKDINGHLVKLLFAAGFKPSEP